MARYALSRARVIRGGVLARYALLRGGVLARYALSRARVIRGGVLARYALSRARVIRGRLRTDFGRPKRRDRVRLWASGRGRGGAVPQVNPGILRGMRGRSSLRVADSTGLRTLDWTLVL